MSNGGEDRKRLFFQVSVIALINFNHHYCIQARSSRNVPESSRGTVTSCSSMISMNFSCSGGSKDFSFSAKSS